MYYLVLFWDAGSTCPTDFDVREFADDADFERWATSLGYTEPHGTYLTNGLPGRKSEAVSYYHRGYKGESPDSWPRKALDVFIRSKLQKQLYAEVDAKIEKMLGTE